MNTAYVITCCPFPQSDLTAEVLVFAQDRDAAEELFYKSHVGWTVKEVKER